ncbi:type II toxin-antitoxin system RelE family toxin [Spirosoma aerophilum]
MNTEKEEQTNNKVYVIEFEEAALRDLKKLSKQVQIQILDVIEGLAINPRPAGVEPLTQFKGLYRVRSGNYRIVYSIEDQKLIVTVAAIADRNKIYDVVERRYT